MDDKLVAISPRDLRQSIGTAASTLLIDVRRSDAFDSDDSLIAGAIRRLPEIADVWRHEIGASRRVIVYCAHRHHPWRFSSARENRHDWLTGLHRARKPRRTVPLEVSNPALMAVAAAIGLIAFPLLQPAWVFVK